MSLVLSPDQVRRVDELAIERYHIPSLILMENAGRNAAEVIRCVYGGSGSALILCGAGNNGGDGLVIARHLHNAGWSVRLMVPGQPHTMTEDARANLRIIEAMAKHHVAPTCQRIPVEVQAIRNLVESIGHDEIVVDALLGTGFRGRVRSPMAELITAVNAASKRAVVAVDVPSGLDCEIGAASNATIQADLTITFVARKSGFSTETALPFLGRVEVVDIGAPTDLIAEVAGSRP